MGQTVATVIAESLAAAGITHAFAVPGESYLPLLDAMRDVDVRLVTCRHEAAAANMAEAAAKLTGQTGVAMVTRGPAARPTRRWLPARARVRPGARAPKHTPPPRRRADHRAAPQPRSPA
ncbi:MAG: thiamine pyrophosphate-binding protein, partial [Sandaracinobacter sp.]